MVFFKVEALPYRNEDMIFFKEFADLVADADFKEAVLIGDLDSRLRVDRSIFRLVKTSAYQPKRRLAESLF